MAPSRTRSMPMTVAMARFADVAEIIKARTNVDEALRDLCEDYRLARLTLMRVKKEKPRAAKKVKEYTAFVEELEDEIMRYLLGAN